MTSLITSQVTQIVLPGRVEPNGLQIRRQPMPRPTPGQVLLRMEATGVSHAEQLMRRGRCRKQPAFPFVPGYDVVGRVLSVGSGIDAAMVGQRFAAVTKVGGWASHLVLEADALVPVPDTLEATAVEAVLASGLKAWQMLHRVARVRAGGTVVVLGAPGGTGSALIQLGVHAGLTVIGATTLQHHQSVRRLGATPLDSEHPYFAENVLAVSPRGVQAIFDPGGGVSLTRSWKLLPPGGILVSHGALVRNRDQATHPGPTPHDLARILWWNALPNRRTAQSFGLWATRRSVRTAQHHLQQDTGEIVRLLGARVLTPQIAATFPLCETDLALTLAESRDIGGKVVIVPDT